MFFRSLESDTAFPALVRNQKPGLETKTISASRTFLTELNKPGQYNQSQKAEKDKPCFGPGKANNYVRDKNTRQAYHEDHENSDHSLLPQLKLFELLRVEFSHLTVMDCSFPCHEEGDVPDICSTFMQKTTPRHCRTPDR